MDTATKIYQKVVTGDIVVPIWKACERNGEYSESYPIGFQIFDQAMKATEKDNGGVREGDLIIITGISGHGKTTFCQNIAFNLSRVAIPSLFFSYEVIIDNLLAKFKLMGLSADNDVIYAPKKIITGNLKWIKEKIQEGKEKYFCKVIFIDHLDFLSPTDRNNSDQLRIVLRNITQELKTIALQEKIIIFLMAHTKKVEGREVEMQDIAESAGIYQLSDYVFSVARFSEMVEYQGRTIKNTLDEGLIKLLKNRLTGKMPFLKFTLKNNIIRQIEEGYESSIPAE